MIRQKYTIADWKAVRRELNKGATIRAVAAATGVNRGAVWRWSAQTQPPDRMWFAMEIDAPMESAGPKRPSHARLSYEDRTMIYAMNLTGITHAQIAEKLGCHRTTVDRELKRAGAKPYDPRVAQRDAAMLARRPKKRKLDVDRRLSVSDAK